MRIHRDDRGPAQRVMRVLRPLLLAATAVLIGAAPAPDSATFWFTITAGDGTMIGYASSEEAQTPDGLVVTDYREMSFQEQGQSATRTTDRTVTRYGANRRPREIFERVDNGRGWSELLTVIDKDEAVITRTTRADKRTVRAKLPPEMWTDVGIAPSRCIPPVTSFELNPGAMAVERITNERAPDAQPGENILIRRRYEGSELRGVSRLVYDGDCRLVSMTQPMFGSTMTLRPASREDALKPHPPYRLLANVMMKSPFRISDPARNGHIRYRFGFVGGLSFTIPQTGEQAVSGDATGSTVDICDDCGPGLPTDAAYLADALRATPWLQSDADAILDIARPIGRAKVSGKRKMFLLMEVGKVRIRKLDFTGHYSALETLQRGAGDCTESAVLLAALGRAAGIPTRVVNGMAYSRLRYHGVSNAFLPHSWVLAYVDGRWQSFDMALDAFDSSHIALTVGDGDARSVSASLQLASLLKWQTMAEVRRR